MRRVVNNLCLLLLPLFLGVVLFTTPVLTSGPTISADLGLSDIAGASKVGNNTLKNSVSSSVPELLGTIVGVALAFLGVIFLLLTIYAGFTWMLAHGKEEYTKKAKDTLVAASIGLVIVLAAYAMTQFVFQSLESSPAPQPSPTST